MNEVIHLPNDIINSDILLEIEQNFSSFDDYEFYGEISIKDYQRISNEISDKGIPSLIAKRFTKSDNEKENKYYVSEEYLQECLDKEYDKTIACEHNHLYKMLGTNNFINIQDSLYSKFGTDVKINVSANFFYPNTDGFMGWHTNNREGGNPLRIYVVYAEEGGISFFRYINKKGDQA